MPTVYQATACDPGHDEPWKKVDCGPVMPVESCTNHPIRDEQPSMSMFSRKSATTTTDFEQATHAVDDISGDYTLDVSH